jgi:integrase
MAKKLTTVAVENAKPRAKRWELPDGGCKGLYLIVQPGGAKGWAVRYRIAGKTRKLTLEPESGAPPLTLAAARKRAADALHRVEQGIDPAQEKRTQVATSKDAAEIRAADSVKLLVAQYVERYCKVKNRAWQQVEGIFRREIPPRWADRSVHDIERADIENLIDAIAADRPVMANRTLATIRKFYAWMGGRSKGGRKASLKARLKINPCFGIEAPGQERSRERVLSDAEIVLLWRACDEEGEPYGSFAKLLLLTGQRRGEVAEMHRDEIDLVKRLWSLPGTRTKNAKPHIVPLSDQAVRILEPLLAGGHAFVFTAARGRAIAAFAPFKARLDQRMGMPSGTPWTLHDIRRTVATGMAGIGIQPHIVEAVLNHVSGHRAGVAGIYNRAAYAAEKAEALQRWADHVEALIAGKPVKVVPLRPRAQAAESV